MQQVPQHKLSMWKIKRTIIWSTTLNVAQTHRCLEEGPQNQALGDAVQKLQEETFDGMASNWNWTHIPWEQLIATPPTIER